MWGKGGYLCICFIMCMMSYWLNGPGTNRVDSYAKPTKSVQYIFYCGGKFVQFEISVSTICYVLLL